MNNEDDKYEIVECWQCGWTGGEIQLTEVGECPECYALIKENN